MSHKNNQICFFWIDGKLIFEDLPLFFWNVLRLHWKSMLCILQAMKYGLANDRKEEFSVNHDVLWLRDQNLGDFSLLFSRFEFKSKNA